MGLLLGTDAGLAVMTANNMSMDPDAGNTDLEITLEGEGELTYTAAPCKAPTDAGHRD